MIARSEDFRATTYTNCSMNCHTCTKTCTVVVVYTGGSTVTEEYDDLYGLTRLPDPVEEYEYPYQDPIDIETLKFWKQLAWKKSRYKKVCNHKPSLKRRMLFSKSGWLARKGRLRKKGKK